jgi:hypothetical protein
MNTRHSRRDLRCRLRRSRRIGGLAFLRLARGQRQQRCGAESRCKKSHVFLPSALH